MQECTCQPSNHGPRPIEARSALGGAEGTRAGMKHARLLKRGSSRHGLPLVARAGFTLLEMVVALAVFVIIIAGVFAIAQGSMELSTDMRVSQERSMIRQNFIEFLRESFRRLPGDADITLEVQAARGSYVPTLSVFNGGDAFTPGPAIGPDASVDLFANEMPGGYLRVGLRMVDADETSQRRNAQGLAPQRRKGGPNDVVLPLIDRVGRFEWQFYDAQQQKWVNTWKGPGRPLFAELKFALDDGDVSRSVFWIPPIMKRPLNGVPMQPALGPDGLPLPPGTAVTPGAAPTGTSPTPISNPVNRR